jgi:hypothetical protein
VSGQDPRMRRGVSTRISYKETGAGWELAKNLVHINVNIFNNSPIFLEPFEL